MGGRGASSSANATQNKKPGYLVINEMIENDIKQIKKQIDDYRKESSNMFHKWYDMRKTNYPNLNDNEFNELKGKLHEEYKRFEYDNSGMANLSTLSNTRLEKMIKDHYDNLQAKVEKKIGKIKYITKTGSNGYNYRMENAKGDSVSVEVIGAGGYNIQRYHTRWVIKK